jgi:hypothetical protein
MTLDASKSKPLSTPVTEVEKVSMRHACAHRSLAPARRQDREAYARAPCGAAVHNH